MFDATTVNFARNCVAMCPEYRDFQKRNYKTITIVKTEKKVLNWSPVEFSCENIMSMNMEWHIYCAHWAKIIQISLISQFIKITKYTTILNIH